MSIIGVLVLLLTDDGYSERVIKMNGQRAVRKYIERLNDKDLLGLWKITKDDTTKEGQVIYYLIVCEMKRRKL